MGNMKFNAARDEAAQLQDEFSILVNEKIDSGVTSASQLSSFLGVDRSALSRALNGKRKLTYHEVIKISHFLGIRPRVWNTIGKPGTESGFLPLYGNVAASVWRVKGEKMTKTVSPIRPIDIGDAMTKEQFCYFVSEGPYVGEYAVCVHVDDECELEDGDMVIVSEEMAVPPFNSEFCRTTMKTVQIVDGKTMLSPTDAGEGTGQIPYPSEKYKIDGVIIGIFRPTRKKK
jgi:transcriptional regulator with XRE-family HTH domain